MQKGGEISRALTSHIRVLLAEARYIQQRREYLECGISDDEDDCIEDLNQTQKSKFKLILFFFFSIAHINEYLLNLDSNKINDLIRMHIRLNTIKNEIDILENPDMRKAFEENLNSNLNGNKSKTTCNSFMVTFPGSITDQINHLHSLKTIINNDEQIELYRSLKVNYILFYFFFYIKFKFIYLQNCLNECSPSSKIFIPVGRHFVKFLEYFHDKGVLSGFGGRSGTIGLNADSNSISSDIDYQHESVIMTQDCDSVLLMLNVDFTIENITLDCRNVRTGILLRKGCVTFSNCTFVGDENSSTKVCFNVLGSAKLVLKNCLLKHFSTAINCYANTKVSIDGTVIANCGTAIECHQDPFSIIFQNARIIGSKHYGIIISVEDESATEDFKSRKVMYPNIEMVQR